MTLIDTVLKKKEARQKKSTLYDPIYRKFKYRQN